LVASSFLIVAAAVPRQYMCIKEQLKAKFGPIAAQTKFGELPYSIAAQVIDELKRFDLPEEILHAIQGQISGLDESHSVSVSIKKTRINYKNEKIIYRSTNYYGVALWTFWVS